jgi:hypothetical protein
VEQRIVADLTPIAQRYSDRTPESLPALLAQEQVLFQLSMLIHSQTTREHLALGRLKLYGWLIDDRTAQVFGLNLETGQFEPLRFKPRR